MANRTALIVDDELSVRRYLKILLDREEVLTVEADNGVDALRMLVEHAGRIHLIVSDIKMPRGDGLTFARAAQKLYPEIPLIIISGFSDADKPEDQPIEFEFIQKPFRAGTLVATIRKMMSDWPDL